MNETAFAPTVTRKPSRMRKTTADAAHRAMVMIMDDAVEQAIALKHVGISVRTYYRYIEAIEAAAPKAEELPGGSRPVPAPLPLFDVHDRIAAIERRLDAYDALIGSIDRRTVRAAGILNDAAHELADWPKT